MKEVYLLNLIRYNVAYNVNYNTKKLPYKEHVLSVYLEEPAQRDILNNFTELFYTLEVSKNIKELLNDGYIITSCEKLEYTDYSGEISTSI